LYDVARITMAAERADRAYIRTSADSAISTGAPSFVMERHMADKTYWDTFKAESENVLNRIKALVHEGNVRRVVVKQGGRTVAEFPLTAGVVGAVLAPVLAAIGALVALLQDCTIEVERERHDTSRDEQSQTAARA
jgi:Domain of unknown function (DUF4342)